MGCLPDYRRCRVRAQRTLCRDVVGSKTVAACGMGTGGGWDAFTSVFSGRTRVPNKGHGGTAGEKKAVNSVCVDVL